jgi:hypothetical protein
MACAPAVLVVGHAGLAPALSLINRRLKDLVYAPILPT